MKPLTQQEVYQKYYSGEYSVDKTIEILRSMGLNTIADIIFHINQD